MSAKSSQTRDRVRTIVSQNPVGTVAVTSQQPSSSILSSQVNLTHPQFANLPVANGTHLVTFADGSMRLVQVSMGRVVKVIGG